MSKRFKIVGVVLAVVAVLAFVLGGTVFAAGTQKTQNLQGTEDSYGLCGGVGFAGLDAVTQLLGLTTEEIQAQLQDGKTLVEIAATVGVTEDALVDVIIVAHQERIQSMVTAGVLTQEQADSRLQWMEQQIRVRVNQQYIGAGNGACYGNGTGTGGCGAGNGMMGRWNQQNGQTTQRGPGMMDRGFGGMMGRIF